MAASDFPRFLFLRAVILKFLAICWTFAGSDTECNHFDDGRQKFAFEWNAPSSQGSEYGEQDGENALPRSVQFELFDCLIPASRGYDIFLAVKISRGDWHRSSGFSAAGLRSLAS
jgi:hypothetical protein